MRYRMMRAALALLCGCVITATASAHDTWVETHTNLVRTGDAIFIDLMLGNHGNEHRDFRLASKIDLSGCTLDLLDPKGKQYDLLPQLVDLGYAPKEGYWKGKFAATRPGMYTVSHTLDKVVNHGHPVRSIKSAKAYYVVSPTLDKVSVVEGDYARPLGHPFELVPQSNPVTPMGPGQEITVQLLLRGKPVKNARVSFIPRLQTLAKEFDKRYERKTDSQGNASFTPKTGDQFLIVAHHHAEDESTKDYDETAYSAALFLYVPEVCPCCGE